MSVVFKKDITKGYHITDTTEFITTIANRNSTNVTANISTDIVKAGCFSSQFDTIACSRYALMSTVIFVTGVLCVVRIAKLHLVKHEAWHHYAVFYLSVITCIFCLIHWVLGDYAQLDFMAQWFKQLSYLIVTHFFWTRVHRALKHINLTTICLLPTLLLAFLYCTVIVIVGIIEVNDYKNACLEVYWVLMSSAELLISQMFLVAGIFISKRLNRISTIESVRNKEKRKLWMLVITFEISALLAFGYDLSMKALGNDDDGCGKIFYFNQLLYSIVFGSFMIIKFALPIWALLGALEPVEARPVTNDADEDDITSQQSYDGVPILGGSRNVYRPASTYKPIQQLETPKTARALSTVSEEASTPRTLINE